MSSAPNATPQIGANLQTAIERAGLSRGEFARRMGIHTATAGRLVTGNIRMSVATLVDASQILGVEPCQLITGDFTRCGGGAH